MLSSLELHDLAGALLVQDAPATLCALHGVVELQIEVNAARPANVGHLCDLRLRLTLHGERKLPNAALCAYFAQPMDRLAKPSTTTLITAAALRECARLRLRQRYVACCTLRLRPAEWRSGSCAEAGPNDLLTQPCTGDDIAASVCMHR